MHMRKQAIVVVVVQPEAYASKFGPHLVCFGTKKKENIYSEGWFQSHGLCKVKGYEKNSDLGF